METAGPATGPPNLAAGPAETAAATDRGARDAAVQAVQGLSNEVLDPSCLRGPPAIGGWAVHICTALRPLSSASTASHPRCRTRPWAPIADAVFTLVQKDFLLPTGDLRTS